MHDIKGNKLQINEIESREVAVVTINTQLRNDPLILPADDNDLIPKWYADELAGGAVDETTTELTQTELETDYPDSAPGYKVIADSITDNPLIYVKGTAAGVWYSIPLGTVAP